MKYSALSPVFLLALIVFLVSCKKDDHQTDNGSADVHTLLKYVITYDSTASHPRDTLEKVQFIYDAQNRVIQIINTDVHSAGSESIKTLNIHYNGTDTLPGSAQFTDMFNGVQQQQYNVYIKRENGKVVSDSSVQSTGAYSVHWYTYIGDMRITKFMSNNAGNIYTGYSRYYYNISGSDVISYRDTTFYDNYPEYYFGSYTGEYFSNLNPYYKLIKLSLPLESVSPYYVSSTLGGPHLSKRQKSIGYVSNFSTPLYQDEYLCTYTFREDGYPLFQRGTYQSDYYDEFITEFVYR